MLLFAHIERVGVSRVRDFSSLIWATGIWNLASKIQTVINFEKNSGCVGCMFFVTFIQYNSRHIGITLYFTQTLSIIVKFNKLTSNRDLRAVVKNLPQETWWRTCGSPGFLIISHDVFMTFTWFSYDFLMTFSWLSHDLLRTSSWPSYDLWVSQDFHIILACLS